MQGAAAHIFPHASIMTAYGMTEAASSITFLTLRPYPEPQLQLPSSSCPASHSSAAGPAGGVCVGWPAPGVQVRIEASVEDQSADATTSTEARSSSSATATTSNGSPGSSSTSAGSSKWSNGTFSGVGEVLVRGPNVMSRYWATTEATSLVSDVSGEQQNELLRLS